MQPPKTYNFQPEAWTKGVNPPPGSQTRPKAQFPLKNNLKRGGNQSSEWDSRVSIPRQKNYSIFGNKPRQVDKLLQRGIIANSNQGLYSSPNPEDRKVSLTDYNNKKDKIEAFGFVSRYKENYGDTFVNNFLRSKSRNDRLKKDPLRKERWGLEYGEGQPDEEYLERQQEGGEGGLLLVSKYEGLQSFKQKEGQESDPFGGFKFEEQEQIKLNNKQFSNVVFDERYLTEEEKQLGLNIRPKADYERDMKKMSNNFVLASSKKIVEDQKSRKEAAEKQILQNVLAMANNRIFQPKYKQILDQENSKREKESKIVKNRRKNGIISMRDRTDLQKRKRLEDEERQKEEDRLEKERKSKVEAKISKLIKNIRTVPDVPQFMQSEHLKNAIKNCKQFSKKKLLGVKTALITNPAGNTSTENEETESELKNNDQGKDNLSQIQTNFEEDSFESLDVSIIIF